ncbi:CPBP family intramembrane metalloprotease [Streptosporangiaceae bacterium NEAU-GS5]|nr:CPBP family intramembrane metalloprotease [Streptosporangiaceae bacterium NEAU-GS5]
MTATITRTSGQPKLHWPAAIALHLFPGAALLAFYLIAAPALDRAGLPPVWGLLGGIFLVTVPLLLGTLVRARRREASGQSMSAFLGLGRPSFRVAVVALAVSVLASGAVAWAEPAVRHAAFGWLPPWWTAGTGALSTVGPVVRVTTIVLWTAGAVVVGPIVEELYFRGWLLPRMPGGRGVAWVSGSALFAVYHLWQPYAWLTVVAVTLPLAWARSKSGTTATILVHCAMNALAFAALLAGGLQR